MIYATRPLGEMVPLGAEFREPDPHQPPDEPLGAPTPQGMTDAQAAKLYSQPEKYHSAERVDTSVSDLKSQSVTSNNPKDIAAVGKCPLWLIPPAAEYVEARALEYGARRYGPWNWRQEKIALSTYLSATMRHLNAFRDGEEVDPESGLIHLAHARATLGIILDAMAHKSLIDDRPGK